MKTKFSVLRLPFTVFLALAFLLLFAAGCSNNNGGDSTPKPIEVPDGALTLAVQPENLQQIQDWGIYPGHTYGYVSFDASITHAPAAARKAILEELGVTMFRVELVPQAGENYTATSKTLSQTCLDDLAAHVNDAVERGVDKYMISLWSPPFHMKEMYYVEQGADSHYRSRLKANNYDLFVEYVKDALRYLQSKGCPLPVALSLQNEPEASWFDTPDNDNLEVSASFIGGTDFILLLTKMRAALNAAGLSAVKLGAPESPSYEGAWVFKWPTLPDSYLSIIDIHMQHAYTGVLYDDNTPANVKDPLTEFHRIKGQIGKESWQTEFCVFSDRGNVLQRLMYAMRVFSSDMVHAGHTVWMWWCGWTSYWSIDNPLQLVLVSGDNGDASVRKSAMFDAFATIFNHVPPGSHVRKVVTNDPSLKTNFRILNDLVAFQTENGTFILLVNGDAPKTYYISGLTGTAGTRKTIAGDNATTTSSADFTVTGGMAKVSVPRNSVNFISTK